MVVSSVPPRAATIGRPRSSATAVRRSALSLSAPAFRARTGALRKALGRPAAGGDGPLAELLYLDAPFVVERDEVPAPSPDAPSPGGATRRPPRRRHPRRRARDSCRGGCRTPTRTRGGPRRSAKSSPRSSTRRPLTACSASPKAQPSRRSLPGWGPPRGHPPPPPRSPAAAAALARLRCVVLVSGFPPRFHLADRLSAARPLRVPSLHIMGEADARVPVAASRALAECFDAATREVYVHGGGTSYRAAPTRGRASWLC
ncbi:hypothetical protein BU14_0333s0012 [Porphyra umbilicalis]|uniref:Serine hydrolase domain-containing protein n=1 Tax=Porphyra umbilicalis TaxID=2786 RepID=A0A1X6NYC4_PORUM|nr:hypothetical protein BU14_0333s0012 [Porphyra umbilicalis]|eukprot:OSX73624.1 hypothetical protein BU14_0333s0012 [Porphyra umbilicalis]